VNLLDRLRHDERGFSLVELLVTMLVGGVLISALTTTGVSFLRTERMSNGTRDNMDAARVAIERIRPDLRQARFIMTHSPSGIATSSNAVVIWVDRNQDQVQQANEQIVFRFRSVDGVGVLERLTEEPGGTPQVLAGGLDLSASSFVFNHPAGEPVSASTVVTITLTFNKLPHSGAVPLQAVERVRLRNVA
jgi:prepilin-type N-terminal cleavage/methylation domain-containing protein